MKMEIHKLTPRPAYTHNATQCKGCRYWLQAAPGTGNLYCCHYLLHTGQRRVILAGDKCGSHDKRKPQHIE